MKLGIFGGTFDPLHLGHLILSAEAHDQLNLDRLLFVLTAGPPHKQGQPITAIDHRLNMLQAAIADNPAFELSLIEIQRPEPQYAVDTVRLLGELHPEAELIYLMGGDSLRDLPTWHDPEGFVAACDAIGVMRRPGDQVDLASLEEVLPGIGSKVSYVAAPLLEISSSEIRERVASGRPFRYYLPPPVYEYILESCLYQNGES